MTSRSELVYGLARQRRIGHNVQSSMRCNRKDNGSRSCARRQPGRGEAMPRPWSLTAFYDSQHPNSKDRHLLKLGGPRTNYSTPIDNSLHFKT